MQTLFDLCEPRKDVLSGQIKESDFAADLAQVLDRKAPDEYQKADVFFANTHPTAGLKQLLENVCLRLTGKGGEAASIFRLDTQYGGGKTHALIALTHAAAGMPGVADILEFIDPALVPTHKVRVAAFDGENADPVNGRTLGDGLRAFTPWGELAYRLNGVAGYERVRQSDHERVAPGADTLRELFGDEPSLILLDELSIYLRKVRGRQEEGQLTAFLTSLFKAVESAPGAVLVFTLAIGKGGQAMDAYTSENEYVARQLEEAEKVAARKATVIDPTTEGETAQVLRRRLFSKIDNEGAAEIVDAYRDLWARSTGDLPTERTHEDRVAELRDGYPFHPALMAVLTDKLSTLSNFQRVRGMLRLLTQTVARLYEQRPAETYAVHIHHMDPAYGPTHNEIVTRLGLNGFDPAIRNDVAADKGASSLAQELDGKEYAGLAPYGSLVARTILWHTFAFNDQLKGANSVDLRYAILGPGLDVGFINDARQRFVTNSAYLDDRPASPLRFLTEANLTQIIRHQERQVDLGEVRDQLRDRIRSVFSGKTLSMQLFPAGQWDIPDDVGDGRPHLAVISHEADSVRSDDLKVPDLVEKIFKQKGSGADFRSLQNNVVFLVADDGERANMREKVVRRLALEAMRQPDRLRDLAEHQRDKVQEWYQKSEQELALAIQRCYRHFFYPSRNNRLEGSPVDLGHATIEVTSASEKPGEGQQQVLRTLADNNKLLRPEDHPLAPTYVRDQTLLKNGQTTTVELRNEFRKDPRLPIMIGDDNFIALIRRGIDEGVYVYRSGDLLLGQGDAWAHIKVDQDSVIFTSTYAKEQVIWPRPTPNESPPDVASGEGGGTGGPGPEGGGGLPGPIGTTGDVPSVTGKTFQHEAPLREALARIWEEARAVHVAGIGRLVLRIFDYGDAFKLLSVVNGISGADKQLLLEAAYETKLGSSFRTSYEGTPEDALPLKDFLDPQLRAATEKDVDIRYTLTFPEGLSLAADDPEKLTERLVRFATGAALVEAVAEAKE